MCWDSIKLWPKTVIFTSGWSSIRSPSSLLESHLISLIHWLLRPWEDPWREFYQRVWMLAISVLANGCFGWLQSSNYRPLLGRKVGCLQCTAVHFKYTLFQPHIAWLQNLMPSEDMPTILKVTLTISCIKYFAMQMPPSSNNLLRVGERNPPRLRIYGFNAHGRNGTQLVLPKLCSTTSSNLRQRFKTLVILCILGFSTSHLIVIINIAYHKWWKLRRPVDTRETRKQTQAWFANVTSSATTITVNLAVTWITSGISRWPTFLPERELHWISFLMASL